MIETSVRRSPKQRRKLTLETANLLVNACGFFFTHIVNFEKKDMRPNIDVVCAVGLCQR